ncbi:hypothetical protein [Acetobacter thailandicus]|uniref:hypothetical protein n=1 Tax=Acetobacter thailandicus TaxID=1502842 RepID=UPI001BA5CF3D|nr:hypothetical protein [Acetobacter thailandicus]MBS0980821.1 hypothetical protein [Acetobacter thailandicus]
MTEEEKTEYLNLRYNEIQQIISDYQDDNITDFNVEYRTDVSIYYNFIKFYENEEFEKAFSELKDIEKKYEINISRDDKTYFEMRTSHLSENEKLQLLH